jgi:hypothetical protein
MGELCSCGKPKMNIYRIYNEIGGYDTYDSAVVIAKSEYEARRIHPSYFCTGHNEKGWFGTYLDDSGTYELGHSGDWPRFDDVEDDVKVELLGSSNIDKPGVVVASFNAG